MNLVLKQKPSDVSNLGNGNTVKKDNVVTVITSNVSLIGEQVQNGINLVGDDRVLLAGQSDETENGFWLVGSGVYGAWTRPDDFLAGTEASATWTHIEQGTNYDESVWVCVTNGPCIVDTDAQEWRNLNEDNVQGFDISDLPEDSTKSGTDFISKHDGLRMEKIKLTDLLNNGIVTLTDSATITLNLSEPEECYSVELGGNRTLALINASVGQEFTVRLKQDATGSRTVTWWDTINWPGGSAPVLTPTADRADYFRFKCIAINTYDNILQTLNLTTNTGSGAAVSGDLIYYWHLNETSGDRVDEVAGRILNSGTLPSFAAGKNGNAADFNGTNQFLSTDNINETVLDFGDSDFSLAMWVNFDSVVSDQTLVYLLNASVSLTGSTNKISFTVTGSTVESAIWDTALSISTWNLIVAVHDSVNDLIKISVNGAAFQTTALSGGMLDIPSAQSLFVGAQGSTDFLNGLLDGFGIWSKALSQAEVNDLYNSGTGKFYPFA